MGGWWIRSFILYMDKYFLCCAPLFINFTFNFSSRFLFLQESYYDLRQSFFDGSTCFHDPVTDIRNYSQDVADLEILRKQSIFSVI